MRKVVRGCPLNSAPTGRHVVSAEATRKLPTLPFALDRESMAARSRFYGTPDGESTP